MSLGVTSLVKLNLLAASSADNFELILRLQVLSFVDECYYLSNNLVRVLTTKDQFIKILTIKVIYKPLYHDKHNPE